MRRLLAPSLISAGIAVTPQAAEAGPLFFPGVRQEMMEVFDEPGVVCSEPVDLSDRTLWICGDGETTLQITEPDTFQISDSNPVSIERNDGLKLSYTADTCQLDRPEGHWLGGEQFLNIQKCRQLGVDVRSAIARVLNEEIPQPRISAPTED